MLLQHVSEIQTNPNYMSLKRPTHVYDLQAQVMIEKCTQELVFHFKSSGPHKEKNCQEVSKTVFVDCVFQRTLTGYMLYPSACSK